MLFGFLHLLRREHDGDGGEVAVGGGHESHDDDVGGVRLQKHLGPVSIGWVEVADQKERRENKASQ